MLCIASPDVEHGHFFPTDHSLGKFVRGHVGTSPGAVDREEPECDGTHLVGLAVVVAQ